MPNKKGGKSYKKGKKENQGERSKPIIYKETGEEYAVVNKMLGGGRVSLIFPDNTEKMGIIRGNMKRRGCWIVLNDLVLVSIREFEEKKCDILFKYIPTHINILKKKDHIPTNLLNILNNSNSDDIEVDEQVIFDEEEEKPLEDDNLSSNNISKEDISDLNDKNNIESDDFNLNWDEI